MKLAVVVGSVRPNAVGPQVGQWVATKAASVEGVEVQLINLADLDLPVFVELAPAMAARPTEPKAQAWIDAIIESDGIIFVSPEYNHSVPGGLKNAIDYLVPEALNNKTIGLVGYSWHGGIRPVEALRTIMGTWNTDVIGGGVTFNLAVDFENGQTFKPAAFHDGEVETMVQGMVQRSGALRVLR